eukprot:sb/3466418/
MSNTSSSWLTLCTDETTSDTRCHTITVCRTIAATLSVIGCLVAFLNIIVFKKFRFFTQRLVLYLLCSCFLLATLSFQNHTKSGGCFFKGFLRQAAGLSQNLWIICINIHLLLLVVYNKDRPKYLEHVYHGCVWGVCFVMSIIPFIGHHYGDAGIWCWIKGDTDYEHGLRVACYYFWLMLLVFGGAGIYGVIIYNLWSRINSYDGTYNPEIEKAKERHRKSIRPLLFYPIVDLVLASISTTNRIQNWANPGNPVFALYLLHAIVSPLWGFANALLFLMNRDTLRQMHPVVFWKQLKQWGITTFNFTKSVNTQPNVQPYTIGADPTVDERDEGSRMDMEDDI